MHHGLDGEEFPALELVSRRERDLALRAARQRGEEGAESGFVEVGIEIERPEAEQFGFGIPHLCAGTLIHVLEAQCLRVEDEDAVDRGVKDALEVREREFRPLELGDVRVGPEHPHRRPVAVALDDAADREDPLPPAGTRPLAELDAILLGPSLEVRPMRGGDTRVVVRMQSLEPGRDGLAKGRRVVAEHRRVLGGDHRDARAQVEVVQSLLRRAHRQALAFFAPRECVLLAALLRDVAEVDREAIR